MHRDNEHSDALYAHALADPAVPHSGIHLLMHGLQSQRLSFQMANSLRPI